MSRRNWKRLQPTSLRNAMELCKDHAREQRNYSVERIAEEMGQEDHWTLYKWFQSGRMPAVLIPAFEAACGIDYVTRWLANRGGKLVIDIPTGRAVKSSEVSTLQQVLHTAVGSLMAFYDDKKAAAETLADITNALQSLAWHKGNVEQHDQPQLELGESDD